MNSLRKLQLNNDDNDENDDDEIAFSLPDGKTGNPYVGRVMRTSRKSITPELNCYSCVIIFFLFPFFSLFVFHKMFSYTICIPTPIARGQAKGNETGRRIPFRSSIKDHTCINSLFSLQGAIIAIVTSS